MLTTVRSLVPAAKDGIDGIDGIDGADSVRYYLTTTVTAIIADENGQAINPNGTIAISEWKTVGSGGPVLSSDHILSAFMVTGNTETQFGPNDWGNTVNISESQGNTCDYVKITLKNYGGTLIDCINIPVVKQGKRGPSLRGPQNWDDCADGYNFMAGGGTEAYADVVKYGNYYYSCIKSHQKSATNYPGSTEDQTNSYWRLGDSVDLIATRILLAQYALVKNLGVETIDMRDANDNILFQAKNGVVTCKTGSFENIIVKKALVDGVIASPFVVENSMETWVDGVSYYAAMSHDNLLYNSGTHRLYWTAECSGRMITLCHHESVTGSTTFSAPTGMYFYEDGQKKTSITVSRQCVILKGYGTSTTFLGYIIVKRIDLAPTRSYGMPIKCLAMGIITGTSSGASISYRTFENNANALSVTRVAAGKYQVTIPSSWNIQVGRLFVMATGMTPESGSGPLYAGVDSIVTQNGVDIGFIVSTGDDSSRNDGSVQFMLFNKGDWENI